MKHKIGAMVETHGETASEFGRIVGKVVKHGRDRHGIYTEIEDAQGERHQFHRAGLVAMRSTSNVTLKDARIRELENALRLADAEMACMDQDAACDHSVGVCWCEWHRARQVIKDALACTPIAPASAQNK